MIYDEDLENGISNYNDKLQTFSGISWIFGKKVMERTLEPYMQLLEYDGSGNLKTHWSICVSIWETRTNQDEML